MQRGALFGIKWQYYYMRSEVTTDNSWLNFICYHWELLTSRTLTIGVVGNSVFNNFVLLGLNDQSESKLVSMLLYSLGEEAEAVLSTISNLLRGNPTVKSLRNSTGTFTTSFSSGCSSIEEISQKESPVTNISRSCTNWLIYVHTEH